MSATAYTKEDKPQPGFLLKEDTFYLLLEDGGRIIIAEGTQYNKETKPTTAYTKEAKP